MENQTVLPTPENILIVGTLNEEVVEALNDVVNARNLTLVRLDDKVITDYVKGLHEAEKRPFSVDEFTSNEENRKLAEEKALILWNMITHNASIESAKERIFTKTEVVQRTSLTHNSLGELLEILQLFGFISFTKGRHEFKFIFGEETQRADVYLDIIETLTNLNVNIARYKNLFHTDEERVKATDEVKNSMQEIVKL